MASGESCCDLAQFTDGSPSDDRQRRAVGQRVVTSFAGPVPITTAQALIRDFCIGSVLLNASNFTVDAQVDALRASQVVQQLVSFPGVPEPFSVGIEQGSGVISQFPSPLTLGAGHTRSTTVAVSRAIGKELACIGVNWILAPTVDLVTELTEPLDAAKKFSDNPETVRQHAQAYLEGLSTIGIRSCAESSLAATIQEVYRSISRENTDFDELLERGELYPIRRLWEGRSLESLLLNSSTTDYEDPDTAQQSFQTVIQRLLRGSLSYRAPITVACKSHLGTDTGSCAKHAPLRALLSGSDVVLLSYDAATQRESIEAVYAAAGTSTLSISALTAAADRMSAFRRETLARRIPAEQGTELANLEQQHRSLIREAYRASTTTLSSGSSPLLNLPSSSILLLLTPSVPPVPGPNGTPNADPFEPLGRAIARFHNRTRHVPYTLSAGVTSTHAAFLDRATAIVLVLCNTSSAFVESQMEFVDAVQDRIQSRESRRGEQRTRKVALAAGDPRDLQNPLNGWWEVCCYEYTSGALEAATEVLTGQRTATGILPVRLARHLNGP